MDLECTSENCSTFSAVHFSLAEFVDSDNKTINYETTYLTLISVSLNDDASKGPGNS